MQPSSERMVPIGVSAEASAKNIWIVVGRVVCKSTSIAFTFRWKAPADALPGSALNGTENSNGGAAFAPESLRFVMTSSRTSSLLSSITMSYPARRLIGGPSVELGNTLSYRTRDDQLPPDFVVLALRWTGPAFGRLSQRNPPIVG